MNYTDNKISITSDDDRNNVSMFVLYYLWILLRKTCTPMIALVKHRIAAGYRQYTYKQTVAIVST